MAREQCAATPNRQFIPADYFRELRREEIFPGSAPMELDIGCGEGSFLLAMARHYPERRFLGLERLLGRVRKVCRQAARDGLTNVRVLRLESAYALECLLPPAAFSRLHLLFPDPWPKKRHHRRRFLQDAQVPHLARVLTPDGELLFKTDHADYFEAGLQAIAEAGGFERLDWPEDAFFYPRSDFEGLWLSQQKPVYKARFSKAT